MIAAELLALSIKNESTSWREVAAILLREGCSAEDTVAVVAPRIADPVEQSELVAKASRSTRDPEGLLAGAAAAGVDLWLAGALGSPEFASKVERSDPAFQAGSWSLLLQTLDGAGCCDASPILNAILLEIGRQPQASVEGIVTWILRRGTVAALKSVLQFAVMRGDVDYILPLLATRFLELNATGRKDDAIDGFARSLGKAMAERATPWAAEGLHQLVAEVRTEELSRQLMEQMVTRKGIESVAEFVGHSNPVPRMVANDLLRTHPDALPLLQRLAAGGGPYQRMNAMIVLESREDIAGSLEGLVGALDMQSSRALIKAAMLKGGGLELLEHLTAHPIAHVRCSAAYHLGFRQDGYALLERLLDDAQGSVRTRAAWSASQRPDGEPLLRKALRDKAVTVRREAVSAIRNNWADAQSLLQEMADDSDPLLTLMVGEVQERGLRPLPEVAAMAADRNGDVRILAAQELENRNDGLEILVKLSQDKAKKVRRGLAEALVGRVDGLGLLSTLAKDEDRFTRVAVAETCGARKDAFAVLAQLVEDPDRYVKAAVVRALGPYPEALGYLERFLDDPSEYVRADLAGALSGRPDGLPGLSRLALDPESMVRESVVRALPSRTDASLLWDLLADDHEWMVRCRVVQASSQHPDPIRLLAAMANNTRWDAADGSSLLKRNIAAELVRHPEGAALLVQILAPLDRWDQQEIIGDALSAGPGQQPREDALDILNRLATSQDPHLVRAVAMNASRIPQGLDVLRTILAKGHWYDARHTDMRIILAHAALGLEGGLALFEDMFRLEPSPSQELAERYILGDQDPWMMRIHPELWNPRLACLAHSNLALIRSVAACLAAEHKS